MADDIRDTHDTYMSHPAKRAWPGEAVFIMVMRVPAPNRAVVPRPMDWESLIRTCLARRAKAIGSALRAAARK